MSYLLLPEDERELTAFITNECALSLLLDDCAPRTPTTGIRTPHIAKDPVSALPRTLNEQPRPLEPPSSAPTLTFWASRLGPIVAFGDPGCADDPISRVELRLNRDANASWQDSVDASRTPVIRWHRCWWRRDGQLVPGLLQGMAASSKMWPRELRTVYNQIERWLRKGNERIDPFDHASNLPLPPPANRAHFIVWARPAARAYVAGGGQVWPWTGG